MCPIKVNRYITRWLVPVVTQGIEPNPIRVHSLSLGLARGDHVARTILWLALGTWRS